MDSGNCGSLQSSSSGGEEEYDSRGQSITTTFLNSHLGLVSPPSSSSTSLQGQFLSTQSPALLFHPNNFQQSLNSQYNHGLGWPLGLRSDPNFGTTLSSAPPDGSQPLVFGDHEQQFLDEASHGVGGSSDSLPSEQPKNPKKRTRASRRAPTTVLTTDTTNFRQMVQEFTGIPAGPFSGGGGGLYSRRLDLFSTAGSSMRTVCSGGGEGGGRRGGEFDNTLRPTQPKVVQMPFMPSSFNMEDQMLTFQPPFLKNQLGSEGNEAVFGPESDQGLGMSHEQESASLGGILGQRGANNDQTRNCSLEFHPHHDDKGLENVVCSSAGDQGDTDGPNWTGPY